MKKLIVALLAFVLIASVCSAKTLLPSIGMKTWGSAAQQLGKFSFDDNGNVYRFVQNVGTLEYAGHPANYVWDSQKDYLVSYVAPGSGETFAGIWVSSEAGATTIDYLGKGWIQVGGIADAYVRGDQSYGAAIAVGSVLSAEVADTTKTAGQRYLKFLRVYQTYSLATTESVNLPRALGAQSSATASKIKVKLRSLF